MTVTIANTNLVDSFNTWRLNTNLAATTISNNVVTVTKTGAARGGTTKGDGHIKGTFTANELRSRNIRGGNTTNESTITLHSNTTIEARTFTINANTEFTGNVNFSTAADDRIILGDVSRIRMTGGNSGEFLRKTGTDQITVTPLTLRQLGDLSSNSAHIILSSSNTAFAEELNSPDLRFSAGPSGQDKFRVYGDGFATAGSSDLLIQLASADTNSNLKIQTNANNTVHTFSADGNFQSTGRLTTVGITTSGTILPSGGSVNIGSGSAKFLDGNFAGTVSTDTLSISDTAGEGVSTDFVPTQHNAKDLGNNNFQWKDIFSSGTASLNNVTMAGTLGVTGDLTAVNLSATGNIDLGNATSDTVTVTGRFDSDLIPSSDDTHDLGNEDNRWKDLYVDGVGNIDELKIGTLNGQGVSTSLIPKTNGAGSLGSQTREWNNLFIDGTAHIDTLDIDENASITGTLGVTGATTLSTAGITTANITTLNASGLASLDGGIDVDGAFTVADTTGNITTTGTLTSGGLASLNGGIAVDSTAFTVADTTGNVATAGTLTVAGATTLNGAVTLGDNSSDAITINGTIQGLSNFTNFSATGNIDLGDDPTDTLSITASVDTNILPTGTVDLGSSSAKWTELYVTDIKANKITLGASGDASGTNELTVFGDATITGDLTVPSGNIFTAPTGTFVDSTVTGLLDVTGSANLGDSLTDTVTIAGTIDSNLVPDLSSGSPVRDIGSSTNRWKEGFFERINVLDDIAISDDLTVSSDLTVNGKTQTNTLEVTATSNFAGDADFDGAITRDGGTVLFDTNGILNQDSIATGAIASAKLTTVPEVKATGSSGSLTFTATGSNLSASRVGTASRVPIITFNEKGQITHAEDVPNGGVQSFVVGNGTAGKTFTITTADNSTFSATVGAQSITSNELDILPNITQDTYGSATQVPIVTVDDRGRVTNISETTVASPNALTYTASSNLIRITTLTGTNLDATIDPASATVKGVASFDSGDFDVSSGAVSLKNATTGAVLAIAGTANETDVSRSNGTVTVGLPSDVTIGNDLTVTRDLDVTRHVTIGGNLTVAGTTTTVNSTTVSIADPIFELGEDTSDDNLDRGIIMKYNNGTDAKKAFMGYDDSASKFVMISDATDTSSVISGTAGTLVANIEGDTSGTHTGTVSGNITSSGASVFTGSVDFNGATIQNFSAGLTGNVTGNADTATKLANSVNIGGVAFDGSASINLPGVNTTGNQDTSGNAATATKFATPVTIGGKQFDGSQTSINPDPKVDSEDTSPSTHFVTFVADGAGTNPQPLKEDSLFTYVPSTGIVSAEGFNASETVVASTSVTTPKLKSSAGSDMIVESADHSDLAANPHQFNGTASQSNKWASGVTLNYKWTARGTAVQPADPDAGSASGLDGSNASINIGLCFPSGGIKASSDDIGPGQVKESNLSSDTSADGAAVTRTKIANLAVNEDKLAANAVVKGKLATGSVTPANILQIDNGVVQNFETQGYWKGNSLVQNDMTISGTTISLSGISNNLTLDSDADIILDADGGAIELKDNGANFGRLTNTGDGNIRISSGTTTMLTGNGADANFAGNIVAAQDITAFSDARLKENVSTIENALDKVDNLRGVNYNMKDSDDAKIGVIAQEVEEILPQVVHTSDDEMQTKSVDYGKLCAVLIEAVKELKKEVDELKGK